MDLTLFQATLLFGLISLAIGAALFARSGSVVALARRFPRSRRAAYIAMGIGGAWTLYRVTQLGEADYGNYKTYLFIGFLALGLAAFKYSPDFLSVRGACIIYLLAANALLTAAFGHYEEPLRLLMVGPVYVGIALALYLAHSPFRLRDFFSWLFAAAGRTRTLAIALLAYGGILSCVAFVL